MLCFDLFQNKTLQVLPNSSKMWTLINMLVTELIIFVDWNILFIYLWSVLKICK
jgi:hypothetical protein